MDRTSGQVYRRITTQTLDLACLSDVRLLDSCAAAALLDANLTIPRRCLSCRILAPQAVDRFINGDYYRHPLTAEAILDVALELRVRAPPRNVANTEYRSMRDKKTSHVLRRSDKKSVLIRWSECLTIRIACGTNTLRGE